MDFVGLGCDRICEVSYKLIGHPYLLTKLKIECC